MTTTKNEERLYTLSQAGGFRENLQDKGLGSSFEGQTITGFLP